MIRFAAIAGRAELWVDGTRLAVKDAASVGPLEAAVPPGGGVRTIAVLVEAAPGVVSGLVGGVTLEPRAR
ncbi:hypothetical protein [Sphingomonas aerolata]|uniref:hypothetical protein n=1 Tax=Sphingomonas aerolata TaxID=185951 RepID=UPI002FE38F35